MRASFVLIALASLTLAPQAAVELGPQNVAAVRAALGGDALLDAVTSLTAEGSETPADPRPPTSSIRIHWEQPDKFVRIARRTMGGGPTGPMNMNFTITNRAGFNGATVFTEIDAPNAPIPVTYDPNPPRTPAEIAEREQRREKSVHREASLFMLPLFGSVPSSVKLDPSVRLFLDPVTHLPSRMVWLQEPFITMTTTSTHSVSVTQRGGMLPPSPPPPAPPPSLPSMRNVAPVEWSMTFENYKKVDGLNWPHKMVVASAGRKIDEIRISRYRINPKIDAKVFEAR